MSIPEKNSVPHHHQSIIREENIGKEMLFQDFEMFQRILEIPESHTHLQGHVHSQGKSERTLISPLGCPGGSAQRGSEG